MAKTELVRFRLDKDTHRKLLELATAQGSSMSEVIRRALHAYYDRELRPRQ